MKECGNCQKIFDTQAIVLTNYSSDRVFCCYECAKEWVVEQIEWETLHDDY